MKITPQHSVPGIDDNNGNDLAGAGFQCHYTDCLMIDYISNTIEKISGYAASDFMMNKINLVSLIVRKQRQNFSVAIVNAIKNQTDILMEFEIVTKSGRARWVQLRASPFFDKKKKKKVLRGLILDINRVIFLEKQLNYVTNFSYELTLPNRNFLIKKLEEKLENKNFVATLILLNFKDVQKLYKMHGYNYVSMFNKSLIGKLKTLENKDRLLYLLEEDVYVLCVRNTLNEQELNDFYAGLSKLLTRTLSREQIQCNIGVNFISSENNGIEAALIGARVASEIEKDSFNENTSLISLNVFNKQLSDYLSKEEDLRQELFSLVYGGDTKDLRLVFQPIVNLQTGKISSFEALARYTSNKYGPVSPLDFIPLVEKNRISIPFGKIIVKKAIDFIKKQLSVGLSYPVAINISVHQLMDESFVNDLIKELKKENVSPHLLTIELTESVFTTNYVRLNKALLELKNAGVKVAIDDFGTGYSSLGRLSKLNVNGIKLDRVFIFDLNQKTVEQSMLPEIIQIINKLGMRSIGEGIETREQYNLLKSFGCGYGQGFFISKPLEAEMALKFVA